MVIEHTLSREGPGTACAHRDTVALRDIIYALVAHIVSMARIPRLRITQPHDERGAPTRRRPRLCPASYLFDQTGNQDSPVLLTRGA